VGEYLGCLDWRESVRQHQYIYQSTYGTHARKMPPTPFYGDTARGPSCLIGLVAITPTPGVARNEPRNSITNRILQHLGNYNPTLWSDPFPLRCRTVCFPTSGSLARRKSP
jgi:hypothetical protein